jgi:hypothetical protein
MFRPAPIAALALLVLAAPVAAPAATVTVSPGTTSPSLDADDCISDSGALGDDSGLDCPVAVCASNCDAAGNRAQIGFNVSNYTVGRRFVENTVFTEFIVEGGDGAGHELDGTVSYDAGWKGVWTLLGLLTGFNKVESSVTLLLWDRTTDKLIRQAEIHHLDAQSAGNLPEIPLDLGAGLDQGSQSNALTAKVIRGHRYRVGLKIRAEGVGALNSTINVDYISAPGYGAWWNDLKVAVSSDLEQRVDSLEQRMTRLETRVDSLEDRVDRIHDQLLHHTHTYLTGRGEGHNNTVATTSEAILRDDGEPSDEEARPLPQLKQPATPLPVRSVIGMEAVGGAVPLATVRFTLPEALPVAIRVYDTQGRVVSDVLDAVVPAGTHEATFDPSRLPAGVYFYRLLAGRYVETRKLTLLR